MTLLNKQRGITSRARKFLARWWKRVRCWLGKHEPKTSLRLYILKKTLPGGRRRRVLIRMDYCVHCDQILKASKIGHLRPQKPGRIS